MGFIATIFNYLSAHPGILLSGVLLYIFIFFLSLFFTKPAPGKNPFKNDMRKPPKPLVTDQDTRDRVLKQGFNVKRLPDSLDAIIVGSGIGGLSTAVLLAKAGKKVLVLEQHDQAGGCCHTFIEKGFEFDVGIHYIGEMRNNTVSRLLVEQLTEGQLVWEDLIDEFDVVALGEPGKQKLYPFRAGGREAWKKGMLERFPDEEKVLDKYLDLLQETRKNLLGHVMLKVMSRWIGRFLINTGLLSRFTKYFEYSKRSLAEVLDSLTDNADLKAVLGYSFGDYGALPKDASFTMHATLINHYLFGGSYPRGGASEIAFHMIPIIERAGGKVLVRAPVKQILVENGKVTGVRVGKGQGEIDLYAPMVISDAGLVNTYKSLLPRPVADKSSLSRLIGKDVKSGLGGMSIFVGLNGTAEELGLKAQNMWAFTGNDIDGIARDYLALAPEDVSSHDIPLLFISFPSTKDSTYNERFPGKSVCTIVTLCNYEWFAQWTDERVKKRGEDYESFKNAIGERAWQQTLAMFPQLADKVEYFDVGTPLSNQYYINAAKGEIYGLEHDLKRFSPEVTMNLRPETDIPGLFLTGQDVLTCGFMGAMFGGVLCAARLLNRNLMDDLVKLRSSLKKNK